MNQKTFKIVLIVLIVSAGIFYGFLVGEYEIFPYKLFGLSSEKTEDYESIELSEDVLDTEEFKFIDVEEMISVDPENIEEMRDRAVDIICGPQGLPGLLPDTVYRITDTSYSDIIHLEKIEQFTITQLHNIKSIGYIFHPEIRNNKLIIYHQGHDGDFLVGKSTIKYFVERGFTIYAFCMPLLGKNNQPVIILKKLGRIPMNDNHEYLKFLDYPIGYFINPVIIMLNYADSNNFEHITMCGISGGGWTTTIAAAIDTRIEYSFPVAGTYPIYMRFPPHEKSYGDFEQTYPELYTEINYLDFYLLGSTGENRKQVQVINQYDPCCFDGLISRHYEPHVIKAVRKFENGSFKVIIDSTHKEHKISEYVLEKIFEEMNSE